MAEACGEEFATLQEAYKAARAQGFIDDVTQQRLRDVNWTANAAKHSHFGRGPQATPSERS